MLFTLNHSSTPSTTSVRVDSSILAMQALWSQNYDTDTALLSGKQSRQCSDMSSYWIRQTRHSQSMEEIKIARNNQKQIEKKKEKRTVPPRKRCGQTIQNDQNKQKQKQKLDSNNSLLLLIIKLTAAINSIVKDWNRKRGRQSPTLSYL